ncbi:uncharacterized protein [Amphiura filiformis]|uniref:uncharacterized protein n=1 Tax=Amphiura filiformis TaxID=82378 RepID=UPI003B20EFE8
MAAKYPGDIEQIEHASIKSKVSRKSKSSISSAIAKAALRKAELMSKQTIVQKRQAIEKKELELQQQKESLEIDAELELENTKLEIYENLSTTSGSQDSLPLPSIIDSRKTVQSWLDNQDDSPGKVEIQEPVVQKSDVRMQRPTSDVHVDRSMAAGQDISPEPQGETVHVELASNIKQCDDRNIVPHHQESAQKVQVNLKVPVPPNRLPASLKPRNMDPVVRPKVRQPKLEDHRSERDVNRPRLDYNSYPEEYTFRPRHVHDDAPPMKPYRHMQAPAPVDQYDQFMPYYMDYRPQQQPYFGPPYYPTVSVPTQPVGPPHVPITSVPTQPVGPPHVPTTSVPTEPQQQRQADHSADQAEQLSELTRLLIKQQLRALLPETKIQTFDGDPLKYTSFMRAFAFGVEDKTDDEKERLEFLCQHTDGDAKKYVESYLHYEDPKEGFEKAKETLAKKFGSGHKIAQAMLKKAKSWQEVKDEDKSLNAFSLFLTECKNMMQTVDALSELDHSNTLKILVAKLPYRHRNLWRNKVYAIEEEQGNTVKFSDLVEFVDRQAKIIANPVFGRIGNSESFSSNKKKAFTTCTTAQEVTEKKASNKSCTYCGDGTKHKIMECRKFSKLQPKEKSAFCFDKKLCFGCLEAGHPKKQCKDLLKCSKCQKTHPTAMHRDKREQESQSPKRNKSQEEVTASGSNVVTGCTKTLASAATSSDTSPLMTIIPVLVKHEASDSFIATYAFLDNGCDAVFASSLLQQRMNLRTQKRKLLIGTLTSKKTVNSKVVLDKLLVGDLNQKNFIPLPQVYIEDKIPVSAKDAPTQEDLRRWAHLCDIQLPVIPSEYPCIPEVTMMIGSNTPAATMPMELATGAIGEPYAVLTPLGWAVYGIPGRFNKQVQTYFCSVIEDSLENLETQFQSYVNHEFNERMSDGRLAMSAEDQRFLNMVTGSVKTVDGHYEIGLPFRDGNPQMPDNRAVVESRTHFLKRKFIKNEQFKTEYTKAMEQTIAKGYAEPVPDDEINQTDGSTWYIPHHGVYNAEKQKLRVVFDCAITCQGRCLNKELLQGPDLTNTLVGVLLRFRQAQVALVADIEAMFCQVKVPVHDRNYLRFLWWPGGNVELPLREYRMVVHLFGATSSPACASFALKQTAKDNRNQFDELVTDTVSHNFYVDDLLTSVPTEEKAVKLSQDLRTICSKGGFHLTKWASNHQNVMNAIPEEERSPTTKNLDLESQKMSHKTLGMWWHVESDQFGFKIEQKSNPMTRRGMMSTLCSLYDPLGFASPVILPAKQMLQELCRLKYGWDDEVPDEMKRKWHKWWTSIPELENFKIQRCWKPDGFENAEVQVHHFADASDRGYGTASYLRLLNEAGDVECNLILSKARVAPIKQVSIPRMELSAATLAVKVDNMIKRELGIQATTIFWSDSQTVLKYIKNETARFPVFVANRIAVIRDGSSPKQWRYVPSACNPADHASRGLSVKQLIERPDWIKGPAFLSEPEEEWPGAEPAVSEESPESTDVEVHAVTAEDQSDTDNALDQLIEHYSSWTRLRRAAAWWLRLKKILRTKQRQSHNFTDALTVQELEEAECAIIKHAQKSLQLDSKLTNLDPQVMDGMVRVGGRLKNAKIPQNAKHQLIIPKDHHIATLIVRYIHGEIHHQGSNHVLAELRQKYWIVKARAKVKSVLGKCIICRKHRMPVSKQKMADLPAYRVKSDDPAFTVTGLDYFGPFHIKQGRVTRKRYGMLFTCMNSRAVHIEVAHTLDTSSCIDGIRRFIARRGPVKVIHSDNGTNLVGADNELQRALQELDQDQIQNFSTSHTFEWRYNPPAASHHGGVWERQIRTVRKLMCAILNEQHLKTCRSDEQLHTFMCEIESTLNSRPLTRVSDDPDDLDVIAPRDLLLLRPRADMPPGCFVEKDIYARRRWRQIQYLADLFWQRWLKEYLPELQRRQRWLQPQRNLKTGDVVLIVDESAPRNSWLMGKIVTTLPDKNGRVRQVDVRTKSSTLRRPISKLCLLLEAEE